MPQKHYISAQSRCKAVDFSVSVFLCWQIGAAIASFCKLYVAEVPVKQFIVVVDDVFVQKLIF